MSAATSNDVAPLVENDQLSVEDASLSPAPVATSDAPLDTPSSTDELVESFEELRPATPTEPSEEFLTTVSTTDEDVAEEAEEEHVDPEEDCAENHPHEQVPHDQEEQQTQDLHVSEETVRVVDDATPTTSSSSTSDVITSSSAAAAASSSSAPAPPSSSSTPISTTTTTTSTTSTTSTLSTTSTPSTPSTPSSSSATTASTPQKSAEPSGPANGRMLGITPSGDRFWVPKTKDAISLNFREWSLTDYLQYSTALQVLLLAFDLPGWFFIVNFLFWRACYNVGLGYLLHRQSHTRFLTSLFSSFKRRAPFNMYLRRMASSGMGPDYSFDEVPDEFNAWLCYRVLVDFVLANDVSAYVVFVLKYVVIDFPEEFSFLVISGYLLGLFLCCVTLWAKMDAYRVVKDFAWYWGDFFFLVEVSLTFDRVFALVPHPMYTIGYAFFYGAALLARSYTVLYVSLVAHLLQLIFLAAVEDPHIEKTYPEMAREQDPKKQTILYDKEHGYFRRDMIAFKNLDIFRSSDAFLVLFLIYQIVVYLFTDLGPWFYGIQAMVWRLSHSIGLGFILHRQDNDQFWVKHFETSGGTKKDAFRSWKRIYNFSQVFTWVTFGLCALTLQQNDSFFSASFVTRQIFGLLLIALNVWSSVSTFEVLGDFGWFYGDFFIDEVPSTLYYTGIYRFLNNPDSVTGCAGLYGLALMSGSSLMFGLALTSQVCNWLFIYYVERPHIRRLHGDKVRKSAGSLQAAREIASEAITKLRSSDSGAKLLKRIETTSQKVNQVILEKTSTLREQILKKSN